MTIIGLLRNRIHFDVGCKLKHKMEAGLVRLGGRWTLRHDTGGQAKETTTKR